jgi:hypothetical protein
MAKHSLQTLFTEALYRNATLYAQVIGFLRLHRWMQTGALGDVSFPPHMFDVVFPSRAVNARLNHDNFASVAAHFAVCS